MQAPEHKTPENQAAIEIAGLNKWYGEFHVLRDIELTVQRGERIVICGPSGSGKSTLLRCINRLEDWQRGSIVVDGTEIAGADARTLHQARARMQMVFQDPVTSLNPRMTVGAAIAEPPRPSIRAAAQSRRFIAALIAISPCQLTGRPSYGGTRRRLMMLSETIQWQTQCQEPHGLWLTGSRRHEVHAVCDDSFYSLG